MEPCTHEYYFWSAREEIQNDPRNLWAPSSYWATKHYRGCKKCGISEEIKIKEKANE